MAEKIRYEVEVDSSDAKRGLSDFSRAAKAAGKDAAKSLDDTASAGDKARAAIKQMADTMDTELRGAAKAAQALGDALGPELAGRTDLDKMVADLGRMGVSFDEVRADADKFAATLKEVDGVRLQQVNDGLNTTHENLGKVHGEADQSRSVLANMAGNAAQDLGQLGGAVGTLGVGIGQLAEYAVDGNISLQNLGKVAGPLAGLTAFSLGVQAVTGALSDFRAKQDQWTAQQEKFNDALRETGSIVEAVNGQLEENALLTMPPELNPFVDLMNDLPILGKLINTTEGATFDLVGTMAQASITQADWSAAVTGGLGPLTALLTKIDDMAAANTISAEQATELKNQLVLYSNAAVTATAHQDALNKVFAKTAPAIASLAEAQQLLTDAMIAADPTAVLHQHWQTLIDDAKDGTFNFENAADAVNQLANATGLTADEVVRLVDQKASEELQAEADAADELTQNLTDAQAALDGLTAIDMSQVATGLQDALDASDGFIDHLKFAEDFQHQFDDALKEARRFGPDLRELLDLQAAGVTITPDITLGELESDDAEFLAWLQSVRDMVQTGVVEAFTTGGTESANAFVQAQAAAFLAANPGYTVADFYNLIGLPPDGSVDLVVNPIIATEKLNAIQPIIDQLVSSGVLSPEIALQISALNIDDPEAALALAVQVLEGAGLEVPVQLRPDTEGFATEMAGVTTTPWGTTVDITSNADDTKDDIDTATENRTTTVFVPKSDSLGQMQTLIDHVARDRIVQFISKADNAGQIDRILDAVAAERDASIFARAANVFATDQILDNLANPGGQPRTATIQVNRVGGGGGGGGGGGTSGGPAPPAPPAGLAATPTTAATPAASAVTMSSAPTAGFTANLTINTGVLGNHFDVERTITRAMRRAARINGRRAVTP